VFTHVIKHTQNEEGIEILSIADFDEQENYLLAFTNYTSARELLERWIDENELCLKYCGLTSDESVCFHHQIKKCRGICNGQEAAASYNTRVEKIVKSNTFPYKNFMLHDKGRTPQEKAIVLIENFKLLGYGYIDEQSQIYTLVDAKEYLQFPKLHPDEDDIVRSWIKYKKTKLIPFKDSLD
jgi:DNA polymerase-3 subunit epsilon